MKRYIKILGELGFEVQAVFGSHDFYTVKYGHFEKTYNFSIKNLLPCIIQDFSINQYFEGRRQVINQLSK